MVYLLLGEVGEISTYILFGNDFDTLNVTSSFEDLFEDVLGDAWVKSTNI